MKKQFSIREALKTGWSLIKNENLFLLIGLILGYLVLYGILYTFQVLNVGSVVGFVVQLVQLFLGVVFTLGFIKICLQITSGEEPEFAVFKDVIPLFFKYLGASVLKALPVLFIVLAGAIALAIHLMSLVHLSVLQLKDPAILANVPKMIEVSSPSFYTPVLLVFVFMMIPIVFLSIRWMFFSYLIVDRKVGVVDSLAQSWQITKGNFWHLFLFALVSFALVIVGFVALILGVFVAIPLIAIMQTIIYKKLVVKLNSVSTVDEATGVLPMV